ncbi:hypothetical protein AYL99_11812 [Fonsecaea erecta]|uniref:Uncharacterized protein n=1 Tax=Fonsecaea erecta TaxID=1367422 RepID=A0A178Z2C9_9EURO|nr:hypothetical protein AYL99_11812 [Fonsecaea erecta]OAP53932.1 hypothetical protein AYL99_11812 [Fonsecaea erecta]
MFGLMILILDRNECVSVSKTLFTILYAAEYRSSMSFGDPQKCMDPFPNRRRDVFLPIRIAGWMIILVEEPVDIVTVTFMLVAILPAWIARMLMVSGVMTRWIILAFGMCKLTANRDEETLQLEHTESSQPWSLDARQTNHPAHLPQISLSGLTLVIYVVMDIGSIHSSSVEYMSCAYLTSILLPLMMVLDTIGSIVHKVATTSGHSHLTSGIYLRSYPSTIGLKFIALLNAPTIMTVNESSDGTPLYLNMIDRISDAVSGGNSLITAFLIVLTSSMALVLLSLSCCAYPVETFGLVELTLVLSKLHVEYILTTSLP